ncbi:unnamed protein product [Caenorhabditis sp. 36 PRJEB53466]|nr:unnamed protein product [Caenorhabditis sp. 36 PRJEB53466]
MNSTLIALLLAFFFVQVCHPLTIEGLFRKLKGRRIQEPYPDEAAASDSISMISIPDKSFIRPIGSIAGRPVIPRRWTYGQPISEVFIDENGIAIPVRPQPSLNAILRSRGGGLY